MIKVAELVKRPAHLSVEEFQAHWRERHGPIVAKLPGLRRYVQSHPLVGGYRKGELVCDGVAELWFDDKEALAAIAQTNEFAAAKADEANFSDDPQLVELVCDEHVIKDGPVPSGAIKSIALVRFGANIDPLEAQTHWRTEHGPLGAEIPQVQRYVQSHVRPGAYRNGNRPAWDGLAITWFASIDDMRASAKTEAYAATMADEVNFIDQSRAVPYLLTTEIEVALQP